MKSIDWGFWLSLGDTAALALEDSPALETLEVSSFGLAAGLHLEKTLDWTSLPASSP
jgi:hypothetical protein